MVVETKKDNLCINQIIAKKSQDITIEGNVIIPDVKPDILKAINTNGTVCIYKKEIMDGKVRLDGSINLYVMYLPDDNTNIIRSINTSLDFTQIIDVEEARAGMSLEDEIIIKDIECKVLNGRKINIKANSNINVIILSNEKIDIVSEIKNIPDMQVLNSNIEINSLVGEGDTKVYAKENINIDNIDEVAEIMKVNLAIINKDIKISYNKVLAKADLDVKIMYLTEDNRIKLVQSQIPVMGFIDISNVSEENICDVKYTVKNVLVKPNNNEAKGIFVEVQLELTCSAYEIKEINVIQDLYSPSQDIRFEKKQINAMINKNNLKKVLHLNEQVQIPEIIGHKLYDVDISTHLIEQKVLNDKIAYNGNLQLKFIFETEDEITADVKTIELPFDFTVESKDTNKNSNISTLINVSSQDFIIGQNGIVDCNINLEIEINVSGVMSINTIEELLIDEYQEEKSYSMIVYFVKHGDSLWEIAKRFRSTVEDIVKVNNIEDSNIISVGQQLFIPKFFKRVLV